MGLLVRFARQWVAGEDLAAAVRAAEGANAQGIGVILNLLGEHYRERSLVDATRREYLTILEAIASGGLDACISVKPSQFGLEFGRAYCLDQLKPVFDRAREERRFLWIDMESSRFTEDTLAIYEELFGKYADVGVCLQANLRRTASDLDRMIELGGKVRLTKGAYREDAGIAFRARRDVDASFARLLRTLFERGDRFAFGSHDGRFIDEALRLSEKHARTWEFQFLKGVRDPLKRGLVAKGNRVLDYVPYGPNWLPYFIRRLRERPRNVFTMVRSLVSG